MAMTEHLEFAYKIIKEKYPNEIFEPTDLYGLPFNRPAWVCGRLVEENKLEDKTEVAFADGFPRVVYQFKVIL